MPISRRQFFRGWTNQTEEERLENEHSRRLAAVEAYVRTNLLPYDFSLTEQQTMDLLSAVRDGVDVDLGDELLHSERRSQIQSIVEAAVGPWREAHWKAEELRRQALDFASPFLATASNEDRNRLKERFNIPSAEALEQEIRRQIEFWLSGLPDSRMLELEGNPLRELVFSQLTSWC